MSSTYHHGDLPDALRRATAELVAERGPAGFSLREVARRAGVSHAAPKYHFGSARGLITSVAVEGYTRLADAFEQVSAGNANATDRLRLLGNAYVNTATTYAGHFGVMFEADLLDQENLELLEASARAYELLVETIEHVRDELNADLDVDTAALVAWSAMHGLIKLAPKLSAMSERRGTPSGPLDDTIERFTSLMIDGFRHAT